MDIQLVIIGILFLAAIYYVCKLVFKNLFEKKSCGSNCKCGVDFSAIEPTKTQK
ncbi:MAG: hypothetical protein JWP44_195 [Mucilaginibacter sp.]|nr:hypothetical protein [Mucilaginibacter sp.]